MTDLRAKN